MIAAPFLRRIPFFLCCVLGCASVPSAGAADEPRPNVVMVITDDQGFGDVGFHGNPIIKTPNLDRLASQSVELTNFHVSPVCSPTRSSLLTGRYNYRTGIVDTYLGRSMMYPDEVTLAEMLRAAGYRTGIFGKWHLGDNYPLRAIDQGFSEALVLRGGGIAQAAGPPGNHYFDPILEHNGRSEQTRGYCSDIYTDAAMRFLSQPAQEPFFVYLAFNCPHTPLEVADKYREPYARLDLSPQAFPKVGQPLPEKINADDTSRVYGMVTNIDENMGRLLAKLDELKLSDNTIVVFLTDNGPQQLRYNAGLRGLKGTVYDGGIRVPCLMRWRGHWTAGRKIAQPAAHIDMVPTLLAACRVPSPPTRLDGVSLLGLLNGQSEQLAERTLFFQWHRGDTPEMGRACAARGHRYKLVHSGGANGGALAAQPPYELFDMLADPYETHDLSGAHPEIVAKMRGEYEAWFRDVAAARGFAPPRIHLGSDHENPAVLSRQDWRGQRAGWAKDSLGHWEIEVAKPTEFDVLLRFAPAPEKASARLSWGDQTLNQDIPAGARTARFQGVKFPAGPGTLEGTIESAATGYGVDFLEVGRAE